MIGTELAHKTYKEIGNHCQEQHKKYLLSYLACFSINKAEKTQSVVVSFLSGRTKACKQMELAKVVARYSDGRVAKGSTEDFYPNKDSFHLFTADKPSGKAIKVFIKELKAVFFVRDFVGSPQYDERKDLIEGEHSSGQKVKVTFVDDEVLVGSNYDPKRHGFFFFPSDSNSNNIRVFAVSSAVKRGCFL